MKSVFFVVFLIFQFSVMGQQSIVDKINTQKSNSGCGIANVTIDYKSANYWSHEHELISKDTVSSPIVKVLVSFLDGNNTRVDTLLILNSAQVNKLLSFYQSVENNANPNPSV